MDDLLYDVNPEDMDEAWAEYSYEEPMDPAYIARLEEKAA